MAACSGSSDADEPSTLASSAPATEPAATSAPDATVAPTTSTTTTTSTTVAPTTTVDPIVEIEAAVKQARLDGAESIYLAETDPGNRGFRDAVAEYNTGDRLRTTIETLDGLLADGVAVRRGDPNLSRTVFTGSLQAPEGADSSEVFLEECTVNSDVAFAVQPGGPEGPVIDDRIFTFKGTVRYLLEDGKWKNAGGELIERIEGSDQCPLA